MELIRGAANHVAANSRVSSTGSGSSLSVYTSFICSFSVAGRQVRLSDRQPPVVNQGDDIVVVGEADNSGVVIGICYINVTHGVGSTKQGPWLWKIGGTLAVLICGPFLAFQMFALAFGLYPAQGRGDDVLILLASILPSLGLLMAGMWMLGRGRRISRALRMIHDASTAHRRR